jgi:nitrile hydratase subunit beta
VARARDNNPPKSDLSSTSMNGIHDLGGMDGFGAITREPNEPVFHADWEGRVFAMANALVALGITNPDEFRHAIERIAPARYLELSYYERWLAALETLLSEKGVAAREAPAAPDAASALLSTARGRPRETPLRARFRRGDKVRARNLNPRGHTRLPRYVRGKIGVIRRDWGTFVFPDTNAHRLAPRPQHVYSVEFAGRELWGARTGTRDRIKLDLWDEYLDPAARSHIPSAKSGAARPRKTRKGVRR